LGIASGKRGNPEFLSLAVELVHGIQSNGDENGIAAEGFLRSRNGLEALVHLSDGDRLHVFLSVGSQNGVGSIDGNAKAEEFVLVDLVPGAFRKGFAEAHDLDPRLEGVVSGDEADISAAHHKKFLRGSDKIAVEEGLEGAGAVDAGKGVSRKEEGALAGTGGYHQNFGPDKHIPPALFEDPHLLVAEEGLEPGN
jgi:hypothetical protein